MYWLAKQLDVHPTTISNWVNGITEPNYDTIKRIAKALEIDPYELLDDKKREMFVEGEASALIHGVGKNYSFSDQEQKLVLSFNSLNQTGQVKVVEYAEDLVKTGEYLKSDPGKE